jgi:ribonuclease P protein component
MDVVYSENRGSHNRFAVIVSRENGCAVVRNRNKRRVRELVRQIKEKFPRHYDLLIRIHPEKGPLTSQALEGALKKWCQSLKE